MVKLNRIYTRTGDAGSTGLVDGSRVSKADPRIAAIGEVDEANSAIGVALAFLPEGPEREMLTRIQNEMFDLGADLATPGEEFAPSDMVLRVTGPQVERLEHEIDRMNTALSPLTSFILPGGTPAAAALHVARATVRRAEAGGGYGSGVGRAQPAGARLREPPVRSPVRARAPAQRERCGRRAVAAGGYARLGGARFRPYILP